MWSEAQLENIRRCPPIPYRRSLDFESIALITCQVDYDDPQTWNVTHPNHASFKFIPRKGVASPCLKRAEASDDPADFPVKHPGRV